MPKHFPKLSQQTRHSIKAENWYWHTVQGSQMPMCYVHAGAQAWSQGDASQRAAVQQPLVQWYDARARVALRRVALWLRVPAAKLAVFEAMLAQTAQVPANTLSCPAAVYTSQHTLACRGMLCMQGIDVTGEWSAV